MLIFVLRRGEYSRDDTYKGILRADGMDASYPPLKAEME